MNKTGLTCDDCGNSCGEDTMCPYVKELHGEDSACCICPDCYHERCMDIQNPNKIISAAVKFMLAIGVLAIVIYIIQ